MSEATRGKPSVAFIGAGKMGVPMIEHLLRAGYGVVAVDPLASNLAIASATGARVVGDIAEALRDADVALSSLPNDGALAAVAREVAASGRRGLIYADTSMSRPAYRPWRRRSSRPPGLLMCAPAYRVIPWLRAQRA